MGRIMKALIYFFIFVLLFSFVDAEVVLEEYNDHYKLRTEVASFRLGKDANLELFHYDRLVDKTKPTGSYNIQQINGTNSVGGNLNVQGDVIASGFVEADDVIIHSEGFVEKEISERKTELSNLKNTVGGEIDKTTVGERYKTADGNGVKMWRWLIDLTMDVKNLIIGQEDHETRISALEKNNGGVGGVGK
jgi:hypothetical protein